ncbi:MAG: MotA/TolQ/ExbB proton channel family protein [Spirochaetaceae bacterium]|jgi:biopolymer transport protein ExbB|nr:MotA/TolQ/ExbB proton channel family protein [Spirochaetaceae bacterium]
MITLFKQGGWVMYPLLVFSVISIAVILERTVYYLLTRSRSVRAIEELAAFGKECGDWKGAAKRFAEKRRRVYFLPLVAAYFDSLDEERHLFEERLFAEAKEIVMVNERRLPILASVASIAPLLGLFGTVLGMIEVFQRLAALGGRADVALLSDGIWVALITTAFGLFVAIPSLLAHHYFLRLVSGRSDYMELLISRLNILTGKRGGEKQT